MKEAPRDMAERRRLGRAVDECAEKGIGNLKTILEADSVGWWMAESYLRYRAHEAFLAESLVIKGSSAREALDAYSKRRSLSRAADELRYGALKNGWLYDAELLTEREKVLERMFRECEEQLCASQREVKKLRGVNKRLEDAACRLGGGARTITPEVDAVLDEHGRDIVKLAKALIELRG